MAAFGKPGIVPRVRLEYVEFMAVALQPPTKPVTVPVLENGDRLGAREFLRRYEAVADLKKSRIDRWSRLHGLARPPVRTRRAGQPPTEMVVEALFDSLAGHEVRNQRHRASRPGRRRPARRPPADPAGTRRSDSHRPERLSPRPSRIGGRGFRQQRVPRRADKWRTYRRAGVLEYLLWRTEDGAVDWWVLEEEQTRAADTRCSRCLAQSPLSRALARPAGAPGGR